MYYVRFFSLLLEQPVYGRSQCLSKLPLPNAKAAKPTPPTSFASPSALPTVPAPAPFATSLICRPTPASSSSLRSQANPLCPLNPSTSTKPGTTAFGASSPPPGNDWEWIVFWRPWVGSPSTFAQSHD